MFTAGFFLLQTVQAYTAGIISGGLATLCVVRWCWFLDHPLPQKEVDVGAGLMLRTYASGPSSTGWWAMVITLVVAGMVLAMSVFSYVFLWSRSEAPWNAPAGAETLVVAAMNLAAILCAWLANRVLAKVPGLTVLLTVAAGALVAAAWVLALKTWQGAGLAPDLSAQGAIVHALLAWQGFFVAVGAIMAVYVVLRWLFGYVGPDRPATIELVGLFHAYVAAQGLVALGVPRLFSAIPA